LEVWSFALLPLTVSAFSGLVRGPSAAWAAHA
jgi:hypothetical protein